MVGAPHRHDDGRLHFDVYCISRGEYNGGAIPNSRLASADNYWHTTHHLLDKNRETHKTNRMKTYLSFLIFIGLHLFSHAQVYVEGGKTRHRFAQLNFGLDYRFFTNSSTRAFEVSPSNNLEQFKINNLHETRLIIGGTHFWGHADFFIAIPVAYFGASNFKTHVETGAKIFPWRIEKKKIRPYFGASWLPSSYQQNQGASHWRSRFPITCGLVYQHNNHLLDLGFGIMAKNEFQYYISETRRAQINAHKFWFSIGYKYSLEATLGAEKDWNSGRTQKLTDTLASLKRLNGLTVAVGLSSASFTRQSRHLQSIAPYADQHKAANIFAEFGIGYYLHQPDIQFNLAYRTVKSEIEAYQFQQNIKRNALSLEAFKFLFDYHGFVPFLGSSISYETLRVNEIHQGTNSVSTFSGIRPGLTFGWDIRPNRIQSWYLRTNLRYFPNLQVLMPTEEYMRFDQLEFNFIQLVLFPGRMF